jgi:hypothetical protein
MAVFISAVSERTQGAADRLAPWRDVAETVGQRCTVDALQVVERGRTFDGQTVIGTKGDLSRDSPDRARHGCDVMLVRTGIASERVTTSTGRRIASISAHQTSACRGSLTTALRR